MSAMLTGKTAFVTGGTGGIGSAICERFAREGAQVIAADLAQAGELPEQVEFLAYDVTDESVCRQSFAALGERWQRLDILVNAAAIEIEKTIEDTTLEEWNRIFSINVTGMFLTSKYALPLIRKSDTGSIINFGSYDGYIADPGLAAYCATKGAVHALTRAMACDHGPEGIRVNAICPGYVDTPMTPRCCKVFLASLATSNRSSRRYATYTLRGATVRLKTSLTLSTGWRRMKPVTPPASCG
jgi:NAD(P)-dependent dehydrogenase (short-subunit alcohol dehydrogenase family)